MHARWVAAYWSRALAQIAAQGHVGHQTLSMEQLITQFLNINRVCIESANKVGWYTDNEMWLTAVEATRRMDPDFDVQDHFRKPTKYQVADGRQALDMAYTTKTQPAKTPGKGIGNTNDRVAMARATLPYKGGNATYMRGYGMDYKGGKWASRASTAGCHT